MRLLLDTNILVALARRTVRDLDSPVREALLSPDNVLFASAASFWEIAIKTRIGKLEAGVPLDRIAGYFQAIGLNLLVIDHRHAVTAADPEPPTRDPFDRLLLAQCQVESLRLVTSDRSLSRHRLAWSVE